MWHEARKQEKKIRGMMVDYKRRAERRRNFYEKIKADPTQFMQIHGRPYKIHLDPAIANAADSPANMMPWQGHKDNLIDRFDVRAHLDSIPEYKPPAEREKLSKDALLEERQTNYERYRILVQNDFLGITEEKFLNQIFLEERYGLINNRAVEEEKKRLAEKKVAIGYVYEDSTPIKPPSLNLIENTDAASDEENKELEDDDSDIDLDMNVEVEALNGEQKSEMNTQSVKYGMSDDDFIVNMVKDKEETEALKLAREIEEEKAMYSGRKSRRERRAFREKRLQGRTISPPSYAAKASPTYQPYRRSTSKSNSRSPDNCGQITFITSFGDEAETSNLPKHSTTSRVSLEHSNRKRKDDRSSKKEYGPELPRDAPSSHQKKHSRSRSPRHARSRSPRHSRLGAHHSSIHSKYHRHRRRSSTSSDDLSRRKYSPSRSRHHDTYSRSRNGPHDQRKRSRRSSSREKSERNKASEYRRRASKSRSRSPDRRKSGSKSLKRKRTRSRSSNSNSSSCSTNRSKSAAASSKSRSKSKSRSQSLSPRPVRRYRRNSRSLSPKSDSSDENSNESSNASKADKASSNVRAGMRTGNNAGLTDTKGNKLTPQERLKRKMQLALNKQYKADKIAEKKKILRHEKMQKDREEELREMSIKLRRRERERRHANLHEYSRHRSSSRSSESSSRSDSSYSRSPSPGLVDKYK